MNKHTPGPWAVKQARENDAFKYNLSKMVGVFPGAMATIEFGSSERSGVDAQLIAAAPDLLAACETIMEYEDDLFDEIIDGDLGSIKTAGFSDVLVQLATAIKKAKGEL